VSDVLDDLEHIAESRCSICVGCKVRDARARHRGRLLCGRCHALAIRVVEGPIERGPDGPVDIRDPGGASCSKCATEIASATIAGAPVCVFCAEAT
jgi:hypothetical protein